MFIRVNKKYLFTCLCISLSVCVCKHACGWMHRTEDGIIPPGPGFRENSEPSNKNQGTKFLFLSSISPAPA